MNLANTLFARFTQKELATPDPLIEQEKAIYFGALADHEIKRLALEEQLIHPFVDHKVSFAPLSKTKIISYGLSSHSYDLRLSPADYRAFMARPGRIVDPHDFDPKFLIPLEAQKKASNKLTAYNGDNLVFIVPGNSYSLGVSLEKVKLPRDIVAVVLTKSTYARCGFITANTLIDAGFEGSVTLEFSNASPSALYVYPNQGIVQLLFFRGEAAAKSYADLQGKYQGQKEGEITLATMPYSGSIIVAPKIEQQQGPSAIQQEQMR